MTQIRPRRGDSVSRVYRKAINRKTILTSVPDVVCRWKKADAGHRGNGPLPARGMGAGRPISSESTTGLILEP
ncbi:MAG: hypothetical protein DSY87_08240 [Methylococcus sp.]|nr:MAG: hypothetical protein DSY87_08240 [Methylococcus sp.]